MTHTVKGVTLPWATVHWPRAAEEHPRHAMPASLPEPTVGDADRVETDESALTSAAVLLDVLSTWTAGMGPKPTILTDLVTLLIRLAALSDEASPADALLRYADSEPATVRALLSRGLCAELEHQMKDLATPPCTPAAVHEAIQRLDALSQTVVKEVRLMLEARDAPAFHQG